MACLGRIQNRDSVAEGPAGVILANRRKFLPPRRAAFAFVPARGSAFPGAESAHEKNDQADQQQQPNPAPADDGTAKVKSAAAEQEKQNNYE